ncbi:MAG: hypothetical protein ABW321_23235 [Polyangiales bacterium]
MIPLTRRTLLLGLALSDLMRRQVRAEPPLSAAARIAIVGAEQLTLAAHASIEVLVELPHGGEELPLALTPRIEGAAVELMRGRLLRSDAKRESPTRLHFFVPVIARSAGTAILRVDLMAYTCDPSCRRSDASATRVLHVR